MKGQKDEVEFVKGRLLTSSIPKNEIVWVSYFGRDGKRRYILTSREYREKYFLYVVEPDGSMMKLAECASPMKLEERFNILQEIAGAK